MALRSMLSSTLSCFLSFLSCLHSYGFYAFFLSKVKWTSHEKKFKPSLPISHLTSFSMPTFACHFEVEPQNVAQAGLTCLASAGITSYYHSWLRIFWTHKASSCSSHSMTAPPDIFVETAVVPTCLTFTLSSNPFFPTFYFISWLIVQVKVSNHLH